VRRRSYCVSRIAYIVFRIAFSDFRHIFSLGNVTSPVYIICGGYSLTFGTKSESSRARSDVCETPTGTESKSAARGHIGTPLKRSVASGQLSDILNCLKDCCQWPISRISYPVLSVKTYNNMLSPSKLWTLI